MKYIFYLFKLICYFMCKDLFVWLLHRLPDEFWTKEKFVRFPLLVFSLCPLADVAGRSQSDCVLNQAGLFASETFAQLQGRPNQLALPPKDRAFSAQGSARANPPPSSCFSPKRHPVLLRQTLLQNIPVRNLKTECVLTQTNSYFTLSAFESLYWHV